MFVEVYLLLKALAVLYNGRLHIRCSTCVVVFVQATVDSTPQISFRPMTARSIFSRDLLTFANIFVSLLNPTLHTNGSRYCELSDTT